MLVGGNGSDILGGDLANPFDHPFGGPVEAVDQGAMADGGVGPSEDEVVGEGGTC